MSIKENIDKVLSKWRSYNVSLNVLNHQIESLYFLIYFGDKEQKKKIFKYLHYLKIKRLRDYIYLKIYQYEIKKTISNEKLLNYFESTLKQKGYDLT